MQTRATGRPGNVDVAPQPEASHVCAKVRKEGWIRRWTRRLAILWLCASLATGGLSISPAVDSIVAAIDRQQHLEKAQYIICLGGDPYRVLEAATLMREGWGEYLVVSNTPGSAEAMRQWAIGWGAPADRIIVDAGATRTLDHPHSVRVAAGLDPAADRCIIVTDFTHLPRSEACFRNAGYRHMIMQEPRWSRSARGSRPYSVKTRLRLVPDLLYEGAAWVEYWLIGAV